MTLTGVNDAPFVDLDFLLPSTGCSAAYTEGDQPVPIAPRAIVFDPDSPVDYGGYSVTVSFVVNGSPDDQLTVIGFRNRSWRAQRRRRRPLL